MIVDHRDKQRKKMLKDARDLAVDLGDQFGPDARIVATHLLKILGRHTRLPGEFYDTVLNGLPPVDYNVSREARSELLARGEIEKMMSTPLTARFITSVVKSAALAMKDYGAR